MLPRKTVAIMQPYFLPYAGYFRLFAAADELVLLDTAQFPKHGYVHRNRLRRFNGSLNWFTLPLVRQPLTTLIRDIKFPADAREKLLARMRAFQAFQGSDPAGIRDALREMRHVKPIELIVSLIAQCCEVLGLPFADLRASSIDIPRELTGEARVIALAKARRATIYLNASGGRDLYDPVAFAEAGIDLKFLAPFVGPSESIAQRLADASVQDVRNSIMTQCGFIAP